MEGEFFHLLKKKEGLVPLTCPFISVFSIQQTLISFCSVNSIVVSAAGLMILAFDEFILDSKVVEIILILRNLFFLKWVNWILLIHISFSFRMFTYSGYLIIHILYEFDVFRVRSSFVLVFSILFEVVFIISKTISIVLYFLDFIHCMLSFRKI